MPQFLRAWRRARSLRPSAGDVPWILRGENELPGSAKRLTPAGHGDPILSPRRRNDRTTSERPAEGLVDRRFTSLPRYEVVTHGAPSRDARAFVLSPDAVGTPQLIPQ